ncbi:MAG: HD domain-containing protein [Lachnospiraceae bacterium]|nr:HD domain-containing protein [Lachnospiraceae bacterium]
MIDNHYARAQFEQYLNSYDRSDDKINLKAVHTYAVLDAADEICIREHFSEEDHQLAVLIALLHDIGRFEQLKTFHSFDDRKFNHADFGVKVLFADGMIEHFIRDRQYDEVIRKAIQYHSVFSLDDVDGLSERELLHCRIIRDADKLDNFRVKDTEKVETLFDVPEEAVAEERISPKILEAIRAEKCVLSSDRVTHMDCWVSYLAFIFDLNFKASFQWILERDYLNRNVDRIAYRNPQTKRDMEEIRGICMEYIKKRAE